MPVFDEVMRRILGTYFLAHPVRNIFSTVKVSLRNYTDEPHHEARMLGNTLVWRVLCCIIVHVRRGLTLRPQDTSAPLLIYTVSNKDNNS